jgi:hypothetical protein
LTSAGCLFMFIPRQSEILIKQTIYQTKRGNSKTVLAIPQDIAGQYDNVLQQRAIPQVFRPHSRKWLRYFLDFCHKYPPPEVRSEQIRLFIAKLRTKKQTPQQCTQAAHAISLYFELQPLKKGPYSVPVKSLPSTTAALRPVSTPRQHWIQNPLLPPKLGF